MPATKIRARVSQDAIHKVTRIFNGTLTDILNELLQNARRAKATRVAIESYIENDIRFLAVTDDGTGITDPQTLVSLGQSEWDGDTVQSEDPAGMGFFALAGRAATVTSRSDQAGFRLQIDATAWTGDADIAVEPHDGPRGTTIAFASPVDDERTLVNIIAAAALHYPLPVYYNQAEQPRADFLAHADHVIRANGVRIGVYKNINIATLANVNFHGVTLRHKLPGISESAGPKWQIRVDIEDAADLVLVLPARKEIYHNPALDRLLDDCRAAIFTAIAREPHHQLAYEDWLLGTDYIPALKPARAWLSPWQPSPPRQEWRDTAKYEPVDPQAALYDEEDAFDGYSFARAIAHNVNIPFKPYLPVPAYRGYPWYDALANYHRAAICYTDSDGNEIEPETPTFRPNAIHVTLEAENAEPIEYRTDLIIGDSDLHTDDPDEIYIAITPTSEIAVEQLADYIVDAAFSPCDSTDADSFDTQETRYRHDAYVRATHVLYGDTEAAIADIRLTFRDRVAWRVPQGTELTIVHRAGQTTVTLNPATKEHTA